jgi:hypothetical protein
MGAGPTIWARRVGSRVQWSAGAAFLVGAAIKLLLLDFGCSANSPTSSR